MARVEDDARAAGSDDAEEEETEEEEEEVDDEDDNGRGMAATLPVKMAVARSSSVIAIIGRYQIA